MKEKLNRYFILLDFLMVLVIYVTVESITFKFSFEHIKDPRLITLFIEIAVIKICINYIFKIYNKIWALASIEDLLSLAYSFIFSNSIIYILVIVGLIEFTVLKLMAVMFLEASGYLASRFFLRYYFYFKQKRNNKFNLKNTLIIGAGKAGDLVYRDVTRHQELYRLRVIAFLDDKEYKIGKTLKNIPILGPFKNIEKIIRDKNIQVVIVAIPSLSKKALSNMINVLATLPIKTKVLPRLEDIDNRYDINKVRDVHIEDLLGRDTIDLDDNGILEFIEGKTVLVTGGGGSIGSELCRQIVSYKAKEIIIFDIYENGAYDLQQELLRTIEKNERLNTEIKVLIGSVRDLDRLEEVFTEYKPEIVFHAAAHKHVPLMEHSPKEAVKNNIFGTYNTAITAIKHDVDKFVLISTDKAVNPSNVMGATKRFAEIIIQTLQKRGRTNFSAVRFGNVLGSSGSVIPLFKKQIKCGGPVTVTHENIIRYFMTIPEACQLVLQSGAFATGGEIFVLDMGEPVKILDLAEKMIRLSGYTPYEEIEIKFTGLRPGEKMYEELLVSTQNHKTANERIFVEENGVVNLDLEKKLDEISNDYKVLLDLVEFNLVIN
ncbi:nucleoside-diphosphate sugar epimerase/dehydratase [Mycoplasmatota bacterium zrk1]